MERALAEAEMDALLRAHFVQSLRQTADHMRNRADPP